MLWLTYPTCGERPASEFRFGGELPHVPDSITDPEARNVGYVWMVNNFRGVTTEPWFHAGGCRRWPTLSRDTITDTVIASRPGSGARDTSWSLDRDVFPAVEPRHS
jgi:sarcosine oxidase subunit delta